MNIDMRLDIDGFYYPDYIVDLFFLDFEDIMLLLMRVLGLIVVLDWGDVWLDLVRLLVI